MPCGASAPVALPSASAAAASASTAWQARTTVRRSKRSATWPAGTVSTIMGRNCASPISPSCSVDPVSAKTCQPTTTALIWNAPLDSARASQKRRKAGWRSSGGMAVGTGGAAGSGTGSGTGSGMRRRVSGERRSLMPPRRRGVS